MMLPRQYRAGQSVEDHCRSCHEDRTHTVIVVDGAGQPLRVACDFCRSEHNFRGGPRQGERQVGHEGAAPAPAPAASSSRAPQPAAPPSPPLSSSPRLEREPGASMNQIPGNNDLERLLRQIIREEIGLTPVTPAEKWRGGELVLKPGKPGVQEKSWPIDSFFHKIVMLRNRLRTLEQQVNASALPDDQKLKLQGYVTGCYGSLTSFNVLFADEDDRFVGGGE
jgi:hypothetical protein